MNKVKGKLELRVTEEEKILRRGYFTFHVLDRTFSITRYKYSVSEYISAYKFYKECRKKNTIFI